MRTEQPTKCFVPLQKTEGEVEHVKLIKASRLFITNRSKAVVLLCFRSIRLIFIKVACCMSLWPPDEYSAVRISLCIYSFRPG